MPKEININDEQAVREEMAVELQIDLNLVLVEDAISYVSWENVDYAKKIIILDSDDEETHAEEYLVFQNEDEAEKATIALVKRDMMADPSTFRQEFMQNFINEKNLKHWVRDQEMADDYFEEVYKQDEEEFWQIAKNARIFSRVPDKEERDKLFQDELERFLFYIIRDLKEKKADEAAEDPMEYLSNFYTAEEAQKRAIEIAGFDYQEAAEGAVRVDGWPHFIASYDGRDYTTENGLVYIIINLNINQNEIEKRKNSPPKWMLPF